MRHRLQLRLLADHRQAAHRDPVAAAREDLEHLPVTIQQLGDNAEREAKLDAKTHGIPVWEALGRVWFKKCRKQRRVA